MERSIDWDTGAVVTLDQTRLPHERRTLRLDTVDAVIDAIRGLAIRGAPAIGVAGALGVAISARQHGTATNAVLKDAERLSSARPTAVNLRWGVRRALGRLDDGPEAVLTEALLMLDEDERTNLAASRRAAELVRELCPARPLRVLTHCNTGRLATVAHGTAIGTIMELATAGDLAEVLVGETRPLLQGTRLTAWELADAGVRYRVCVDSAGPAAIAAGMVDCVLVGADRIAANGDVANKIGTYSLAVASARHGVPFLVIAPESTIDPATASGRDIPIEQRDADEVLCHAGARIAPEGTAAFNPAFDVTPAELVAAIVTESRVIRAAEDQRQVRELITLSGALYHRGWLDGTSGNLSVRPRETPELVRITASGRDKGALSTRDIVALDFASGRPHDPAARPSAETAIHLALYRTHPDCGAVVHAHMPCATALSALIAERGEGSLLFEDYELIKGFGLTRVDRMQVPVFANHRDVSRIGQEVESYYRQSTSDEPPVLLIAHHGATAWGPDLATARNRLECLEGLCRLYTLRRAIAS
jgi:methylthioribose-1-phosphate isomerase